jgi:hypothetical protein
MKNPILAPLIGGIAPVILGDAEAKKRAGNEHDNRSRKTVLERKVCIRDSIETNIIL